METTPQPKKRSKKWIPWVIVGAVVWELISTVLAMGVLLVVISFMIGVCVESDEMLSYEDPAMTPVTQTLANGDTFYTPDYSHAVRDEGHTVMYYDNLLLVFTEADLFLDEQNDLAALVDGQVVGTVSGGVHAVQLLVPEANLEELQQQCDALMADSRIMYACPEYPVQILGDPYDYEEEIMTDTLSETDLWWQEAIGAPEAWRFSELCQDIKVGIVDAGFYDEHEDLAGQITYISNDEYNTADDHGTHVAGIIGAQHNGTGIRGIAPHAQLYCADVWPEWYSIESYHTMTELLAVINAMAQEDVRVVNHSWGAIVPSEETYLSNRYGFHIFKWLTDGNGYRRYMFERRDEELVPTAEACLVMMSQLIHSGYEDLIMVQAAGNGYDNGMSGCDAIYNGFFCRIDEALYRDLDPKLLETLTQWGVTYEQIEERILVVGAVEDKQDKEGRYYLTDFSCYGDQVDICAPGADILSCVDPYWTNYEFYDGTSMAAPMVTGSVAYVWSLDPELSAGEVKALLLENTETEAAGVGEDKGSVYPMLNVGLAVRAVLEEII